MGRFQAIYGCAFLLVVLACHETLRTEGRQLKVKKQEITSIEVDLTVAPASDTKAPGVDHSVATRKGINPPKAPTQSLGLGDLAAQTVDDFRPTTPGNSPGVGHSFHQENVSHYFTAGNSNDFRPTVPGHSPGVGLKVDESLASLLEPSLYSPDKVMSRKSSCLLMVDSSVE
ncbi:hypothetical protein RJ639_023685 [Escallonia herrerae]|uniref:Uncharacterized protein n=1 Tax=Escallonia herrerae TaxID=1293975 RepID=A0AA88V2W7_9ASTE|nr:hypothetical protein RJ639_023685 [Escallonia herrerae]